MLTSSAAGYKQKKSPAKRWALVGSQALDMNASFIGGHYDHYVFQDRDIAHLLFS